MIGKARGLAIELSEGQCAATDRGDRGCIPAAGSEAVDGHGRGASSSGPADPQRSRAGEETCRSGVPVCIGEQSKGRAEGAFAGDSPDTEVCISLAKLGTLTRNSRAGRSIAYPTGRKSRFSLDARNSYNYKGEVAKGDCGRGRITTLWAKRSLARRSRCKGQRERLDQLQRPES